MLFSKIIVAMQVKRNYNEFKQFYEVNLISMSMVSLTAWNYKKFVQKYDKTSLTNSVHNGFLLYLFMHLCLCMYVCNTISSLR